jgi:23S rRNA (pseudouridine1915-N3)-methyltransferase
VRLFVYFIGKPREHHANAMVDEYVKRTRRYARCQVCELDPRRHDPWVMHPSATKVVLDPAGRALDSRQFLALVEKAQAEARDLVFLLGGADGLPPAWRASADLTISLSPLTLPHELARLVLAEQIYRAFATLRGHPYPR